MQSRRNFIKNIGVGGAAFTLVPRFVLGKGYVAPSDTVYIAGIGVGGKGTSDLTSCAESKYAKIAYLCDVDDSRAAKSRENFPDAKYYRDFREMLDKEGKNIDAVTVSTPDHTHAVAALDAMKRGKHVYVQKPLTWSIEEARMLTEAAKKYKVVTQMGNQGGSGDGVRRMKEMVDAGLVGDVHKIVSWTNRPIWPQGIQKPTGNHPIPSDLDWDLWLGPAAYTDYQPVYVPFGWRGWFEFGTGALGDMACHILDPAFRILPIDYPSEVECSAVSQWGNKFNEIPLNDSYPSASAVYMKFPVKGSDREIDFTWLDGGIEPERPEELGPEEALGDWSGGIIFEGSKGKIMADCYGANPRLIPTARMDSVDVKETIPRVPEGHYVQWVNACKAGYGKAELSSPFEYAGPMTEAILLGSLAIRAYQTGKDHLGRKRLLWDAKNMKITNYDDANAFVQRQYREGWSI